MTFSGNLVYSKVVDNSVIYMLLECGGIWLCGLGVMSVQSWVSGMVALCLVRT